jgi:F-box domain
MWCRRRRVVVAGGRAVLHGAILRLCLGFLGTRTVAAATRVCTSWKRVAADAALWVHVDILRCTKAVSRRVYRDAIVRLLRRAGGGLRSITVDRETYAREMTWIWSRLVSCDCPHPLWRLLTVTREGTLTTEIGYPMFASAGDHGYRGTAQRSCHLGSREVVLPVDSGPCWWLIIHWTDPLSVS